MYSILSLLLMLVTFMQAGHKINGCLTDTYQGRTATIQLSSHPVFAKGTNGAHCPEVRRHASR